MEEHAKDEKSSQPAYNQNPKSIKDLGYKFEDRKLVDIETGGKFKFIDQKHYEILGDLIVTEIQGILLLKLLFNFKITCYCSDIMKNECNMVEVFVPETAEKEKQANVSPKVSYIFIYFFIFILVLFYLFI